MERNDEIVEEVRMARAAYFAEFDYDLVRIFEDVKKREQEHPERLATLKPAPPERRVEQENPAR